MDASTKTSPCKDCEEVDGEADLLAEVDHLRQHLTERDSHIIALEEEFLRCTVKANDLEEQLSNWRSKYDRIHDSHKRVQTLNQGLEDKLLHMVDKMKGDKNQLTKDIATLSVRLAESKHNVTQLQKENERYKNDMNLAIQLLQCKPDNFVSQKLDNLPVDTQARVSQYVIAKTKGTPSQSKNGNEPETFDTNEYEFNISASLMSKILEDSINDTVTKHCDTCTCGKAQNKPFSYDETHYTISTQTSYDDEKFVCANCHTEAKSIHCNPSAENYTTSIEKKVVNNKNINIVNANPSYLLPQVVNTKKNVPKDNFLEQVDNNIHDSIKSQPEPKIKLIAENPICVNVDINKINEDFKQLRNTINNMEPQVHHKICDRPRNSITSIKDNVDRHNDLLVKEIADKDEMSIHENNMGDNFSVRKNSHSSMGAISRTSSAVKSTSSNHKSNTQVGPGPRFCSLRMQAGSKNILLDNAQPDVPPVLYKRQPKCTENSIFKDLTDVLVHLDRNDAKNNTVVESTLVDVHVDNNNKNADSSKNSIINPVLMNVSSSPLQPLKTHSFSNGSETNNNGHQTNGDQILSQVDSLLGSFDSNIQTKSTVTDFCNVSNEEKYNDEAELLNVKNKFDLFQSSYLRVNPNKAFIKEPSTSSLSSNNSRAKKQTKNTETDVRNVNIEEYSNKVEGQLKNKNKLDLFQSCYLKVNQNKKAFVDEPSTPSSLSSNDSAAVLENQLRVAKWVDKNVEQQFHMNNEYGDHFNYKSALNKHSKCDGWEDEHENCVRPCGRIKAKKQTKIAKETIFPVDNIEENFPSVVKNIKALNMPHPVSKYSKLVSERDEIDWTNYGIKRANTKVRNMTIAKPIAKETIFPADDVEENTLSVGKNNNDLSSNGNTITAEELARMEYNVKNFLLSGAEWVTNRSRVRRTSSKTETDV